ncbi:MAG: glycerate dehydrogenase [Clostridiales bacterium GWF2_38_85]|nr:MAG: glycerate dehydrogenase [Clostridiales bacterium GWF2_38_85]HBL83941.1 glycerate dehydrogenase [Clostridiales bacterium]
MNIVVLDRNTVTNGDILLGKLDTLGNVKYYGLLTKPEIIAAACDAEAIICNKAIINREAVEACSKLRYIGLFATGYNNINLQACSEHGIMVANAPNYSTNSVAQQTFALILQLATHICEYNTSVHDGDWVKSKQFSYFPFPIHEINGKTLGIYGFGNIGKAVANIADAFGMKVLISTRTKPENCKYEFVGREELFLRSDYLTIHSPLTPETKEMVNSKTIGLMKKTAFLINTSRGGVINEGDLADALNNNRIAGVGLDVLTVEPMVERNPLLTAKNCVITPHIAWASYEARTRLITLVADNLRAFQNGQPQNIVNV